MLSRFSHVQFFVTPWTIAHQAPLSMGFSRQEYWSGLLFPTPEDLPDSGLKPVFPAAPALAGGFFTISATWEVLYLYSCLNRYVCTVCVCVCVQIGGNPVSFWGWEYMLTCGIMAVSCKG